MIQRIQSVYLLLATLISGGLIFVFNLWVNELGNKFFVIDSFNTGNVLLVTMSVLFFVSAILSCITIFIFKNRQLHEGIKFANLCPLHGS